MQPTPTGLEDKTIEVATEIYWHRFLKRVVSPEFEPDRRRNRRRYGFATDVKILFTDSKGESRRSLCLLEISDVGLTAKGYSSIPADTHVRIELNPEGSPFALEGRVVHCTETLGGYKIGILLQFKSS